MAKPKLSSLLVIGVDLRPFTAATDRAATQQMIRQLLSSFDRYQLAASWALADVRSSVTSMIRQSQTPHEVALRWTGSTTAATTDAFELAARLRAETQAAERDGLQLRSLAVDPRGRVPYHALAKAGIRTIRPTRVRTNTIVTAVQPQPLRYGLWGLPVSGYWPHPNRLWQRFLSRQLLTQLRMANQQGRVVHLVLDVDVMVPQIDAALRGAERLLSLAADLRDSQQLRTGRLADVDRWVRIEMAARPAHSILRRVA